MYAYISLLLSAVVALAVSLLWRQNGKNCDTSEEELREWCEMEAKTEHVNAATTLWSPCWEQWVQERGAAASKESASQSWEMTISLHSVRFIITLTSSNSFNVRFAILLTFHISWLTVPKAHATPTYSGNAYMLVQRSLRCLWGLYWECVNLVLCH